MIINFKSIHLHNFMSFEDSVFSLFDHGYNLITGINNNVNDNASSNGSGKSSIWEGLLWALTGETLRGCKNVKRLGDNDGCFVKLDFSIDKDEYSVIRSKDSNLYKTNLKIYINDQDKSAKGIRDSEKLLKDYLPDISASLIGSVIILGQGLPYRFTNNTPSGRKEVLEKLSKSDFMISDIKDRIIARKIKLQKDLRENQDNILQAQSQNQVYQQSIDSISNEIEALKKLDIDIINLNIEAYEKLILDIDDNIKLCNNDIDMCLSNIDSLQNDLSQININIINSIKDGTEQLQDKLKSNIDEINSKQQELLSKQHEVNKLDNIKDTCPTCGQRLEGVVKPDTTQLHAEIDTIKSSISILQEQQMSIKEEIQDTTQKITEEFKDKQNSIQQKIKDIQKGRQNIQTNLQKYNSDKISYQNSLRNLYSDKELFEKQSTKLQSDLESINKKIENNKLYIYNINSNIQDINCHIETIQKFDTLVKRDFRGYLLKNVIEYIDNAAKKYCIEIFGTQAINFELDGNNISITYLGKEYESLSGGEKQKIDIIVQFSMRDMLCKLLNFSSNILVLDEVTDNLDAVGCDKVINLISTKLHDIQSVYIISHRKDLDIPYDREIVIEKSIDGISKLVENAL